MKKVLVIVDCQKDFVSGVLGFDGADEIMKSVAKKAEEYYRNGDDIVFTMDTHSSDYMCSREGKNLPVVHCIKGSDGWQTVDVLNKYSYGAQIFEKNTFGSRALGEFLTNGQYDMVELAGVVANICVISNAVIALTSLPYAEITVDAKCVGGADDSMTEKALDIMQGLHVTVINR